MPPGSRNVLVFTVGYAPLLLWVYMKLLVVWYMKTVEEKVM